MSLSNRVRDRLEHGSWPRVHAMLIVSLSSAAAFLVSVLLITSGVQSMAVRYGLAAIAGYAVFLLLIGGWIRWKSSRLVEDTADAVIDAVDLADLPMPRLPREGGPERPSAAGGPEAAVRSRRSTGLCALRRRPCEFRRAAAAEGSRSISMLTI